MSRLTEQQTGFLLQPISGKRVRNLRGLSHLEAWDVRRQLIRIFGFEGFTVETLGLDLVHENVNPNYRKKNQAGEEYGPTSTAWTIVYRAQVRLTLKTTSGETIAMFEDAAAGDAVNQPSVGDAHDLAMKSALSQALKRCAVNLGDQFGLSLYNKGSQNAVVMRSIAYMGEPVKESEDVPVGGEPTLGGDGATDADPEWQAALAELRRVADSIGFSDGLPGQFQATFGHPVEEGTAAEFREATSLMRSDASI